MCLLQLIHDLKVWFPCCEFRLSDYTVLIVIFAQWLVLPVAVQVCYSGCLFHCLSF